MFHNLRLRFIAIAAIWAGFILFAFTMALNLTVDHQNKNTIQTVLSVLTANDGSLPSSEEVKTNLKNQNIGEGNLYTIQYFSAIKKGSTLIINTGTSQSLSEEDITNLTETALKRGKTFGTITFHKREFSYQLSNSQKRQLVVFYDTTNFARSRSSLISVSFWVSLWAILLILLFFFFTSKYYIRPYVQNYEKQRIFITNAGHELKTPLAIISANTELQELMTGENEWTESTKAQIDRLNRLIARLIRLARLEEQEHITVSKQDISTITNRVCKDHETLIHKEGKKLELEIQSDVQANVSEEEFYELISIMLDNARKYCDPEGTIQVRLSQSSRFLLRKNRLIVSNDYVAGSTVDYKRFFDRFYRADSSRNSQTGSGYGIGLSMAQHLVELFKGRIWVNYKKGRISFHISLP